MLAQDPTPAALKTMREFSAHIRRALRVDAPAHDAPGPSDASYLSLSPSDVSYVSLSPSSYVSMSNPCLLASPSLLLLALSSSFSSLPSPSPSPDWMRGAMFHRPMSCVCRCLWMQGSAVVLMPDGCRDLWCWCLARSPRPGVYKRE